MPNFVIGPKTVNVTNPFPNVSAIPNGIIGTTPQTAQKVANGWYDNAGHLIFYVCDDNVFDYNNTFLGTIPNNGSEVAIVPFGDNDQSCHYKFNIFSTSKDVNTSLISLYKTVLDMAIFDLQTPQVVDAMPFQVEFGTIAVGQKTGIHEPLIYFSASTGTLNSNSGRIDRLTIHNDGTVSVATTILPTSTILTSNAAPAILNRELDLSPDGQWLGWASMDASSVFDRYHIVKLDANGDADISAAFPYQQFSLPNSFSDYTEGGARGVEFFQDGLGNTKVFFGAGLYGIYGFDVTLTINASNYFPVSGSAGTINSSYGYSQLELAKNGFMYSSSINSNYSVGAFNPNSSTPAILFTNNSFTINNPPWVPISLSGSNHFYTLPDQIDGQDYSVYPAPIFQDLVISHGKLTINK